MTTILALDTSSRAVGWAVFVDGKLEHYGKWVLDPTEPHGERMHALYMHLTDAMEEYTPNLVVYEAPYQGRMKNAFSVLSKYVATVELTYRIWAGHPLPEDAAIAAHLVKRRIGAPRTKSHADNKREVVKLVNSTFGLRLKYHAADRTKQRSDDDIADAIAVGWAYLLGQAEEAPPDVPRKRVVKRRRSGTSAKPPRSPVSRRR